MSPAKRLGTPGLADRLARGLVLLAARRWPREMADEWLAELETMRSDRRPGRAWRSLAFAGSLALSPAVEAEDEAPATWQERLAAVGMPAALTLLAAGLFNAVHLTQYRFGPLAAGLVLAVAATALALLGQRPTATRVTLLGAAMYAFLLAGNEVAVMPFMGWIDIAPAVLTWTALTALTVRLRLGPVATIAGAFITLDLTAIAGSLHAATSLGVSLEAAPLWFPLALLPGGTAWHSGLLLGNTAAMVGPLALCSVFITAGALRSRFAAGVPLGLGVAVGGLAACELIRRSQDTADATLHRLLDNSAVFGFGFLAHPAGLLVTALVVAALIAAGRHHRDEVATPM